MMKYRVYIRNPMKILANATWNHITPLRICAKSSGLAIAAAVSFAGPELYGKSRLDFRPSKTLVAGGTGLLKLGRL
jgi:hypothetical protein